MNLKKLFGKDTDNVVYLCQTMYDRSHRQSCDDVISMLCGICKFHHTRIEWCGTDTVYQPDKWIVYRNGIRYILTIDALRYDGIYARLKKL